MQNKLIIEGNSIYEIDEECMRHMRDEQMYVKKNTNTVEKNKVAQNRNKRPSR